MMPALAAIAPTAVATSTSLRVCVIEHPNLCRWTTCIGPSRQ